MSPPANHDGTRRVVFVWLWAVAVLIHTLYLPGPSALLAGVTMWNVTHLALGLVALVLLCRPRSNPVLAVVCIGVPVTAWVEAPRLGNHWLLASIVAMTILASMTIGALRRPRNVDDALAVDGFASARLVFLVAYGFAAFAKYNSSFTDASVSCANVFLDQVATTVGLSGLGATSEVGWTRVVPFVVMALETSVVVLLTIARTRVLGVILAVSFHGIISINTDHSFSDFSVVIAMMAVLFLPDDWFDEFGRWLRGRGGRTVARVVTIVVTASLASLLVWQSLDDERGWSSAIGHGREVSWWTIGAVLWGGVVFGAVRTHTLRSDVALLPDDRWMLMWPSLAVIIGLGPWLGVRTATSWNMYANLVTARGETNSWLVPGTLSMLDESGDLVRILVSSDPALSDYVDSGDRVPMVNLRQYTATARDFSLVYERDGVVTTVPHTRDDSTLGRAPAWWWNKALTYRSVDLDGPATCQEMMGALR
ncbi:MAG: hypothetical protein FGM58_04845 [Acidimicrobiia bacterium]|nr:hypothetical protein [Acidimicrobiia bacterium]